MGGADWQGEPLGGAENRRSDDVESLLRARTDLLAAIVDSISDLLFRLDDDGTVLFANDRIEGVLGIEQSAVVGRSLESLVATDVVDDEATAFPEDLCAGDGPSRTVCPVEAADGSLVTLEFSGTDLDDADGYVCIASPVRSGALVESIADPLYVLDESGTIEQVNEAMLEYTGYDREQVVGRSARELIPEREYDRVTRRLMELVESGEGRSETFETAVVTREGAVQLTEVNVTVNTAEDGSYAGSVGVLRDINDRKQRERDLELLKQVLTRLVRHNVRNDLNIVKGHTETIQSIVDPDGERSPGALEADETRAAIATHTDEIIQTADRLLEHGEKARLIEEVIETDSTVDVDLEEAVGAVVSSLHQQHPDASIDVAVDAERSVRAHPKIRAAIRELIENAIQHAPAAESPVVSVWTDEADEYVTLFVEDESGGLDDDEIDVIRRGAEDALDHGSGVGLWLVRWIVEYSPASMIAHRTEAGSLMGIRFEPPDPDSDDGTEWLYDERSTFVRAPARVLEDVEPDRVHGETVVGRTDELHELERRYDTLEHNGGHAVLLTGEQGMGKSTLVDQFLDRLHGRHDPPVVARGSCESGVTRPYHVFRQVMDECPGAATLWGPFEEPSTVDEDPEALERRRQALFADVADQLRSIASDSHVVLVLENLQWADWGTVSLLEYLIDEVGQWASPIMFLGTYRPEEVDGTHPVREVIERTADTGRGGVIELAAFGPAEVEGLLAYILDVEHVPQALVDAVYEHTGGMPSFVAETGRHLAETLGPTPGPDDLPKDLTAVPMPESVESAVEDRLASLSVPVRSVLELGAVVGETISFDVLRRASGLPETALVDYVDRLVERRIWERSEGQICFVQGALRERALAALESDRRSALHAAVADAVETVYESSLEDQYGRLATHYEAAGEPGEAIEYYRLAGDQATEAYGHEDAAEFYRHAAELAADADLEHAVVASLRADRADVLRQTGAFDRARSAARDAVSVAPSDAPEACRALGILADARIGQSDYESAKDATERQRSLATRIGDRQFEAEAIQRLGLIARHRSEYDTARDHLETCLPIATELNDHTTAASIKKELGTVALRQGELEEAKENYRDALETAESIDSIETEAACLTNIGAVLHREGDYESASENFQRALDKKRSINDRAGEATVLGNLGLIALGRNEYDVAREYLQESADIKDEVGDRQGLAHTYNLLGIVEGNLGRYDVAREYLEESVDTARSIDNRLQAGWSLASLGEVVRRQGLYDRAREHVRESLDVAKAVGSPTGELDALRELGAIALERGKYDRAREFLDDALDVDRDNTDPQSLGRAHLEQARLELNEGDLDAAREDLDRARDAFDDIGAPHWLARCRVVRGRIAAADGRSGEARAHWEDAVDTFDRIGTLQDALATARRLVEHCRDGGDDDGVRRWHERAKEFLEDAPEPIVEQHREWIEEDSKQFEPP